MEGRRGGGVVGGGGLWRRVEYRKGNTETRGIGCVVFRFETLVKKKTDEKKGKR